MNKKLSKKIVAISTAGVLVFSFIPLSGISAKEATVSQEVKNDELYENLSGDKKKEFKEIVDGLDLNKEEQEELLEQREDEKSTATVQWKTAVIKKAAEIIAAKTGEKSVAEVTDFLFEWEDDLQTGMEKALVKYGHFNDTVAHWTAKSVMFVLL